MTTDRGDLTALAAAAEHRRELRSAADDLLAREWSLARAHAALDAGDGIWSDELWGTVSQAGWDAILVDDPDDGGGRVDDLCTLAEAVGRAGAPLPLAAAVAAAWCAGEADGLALLVADVTAGERVDGRLAVSGSWPVVPYGMVATRFVTAIAVGAETLLVSIEAGDPGLERAPVTGLDRAPSAAVTLDRATAREVIVPDGTEPAGRFAGAVARLHLGLAAELTGVAAAASGAAVEYAKERHTFGRPIGANQAIKHRLVDDRAAIELSRALVARAADAVQSETSDASALTSLAAFWAIDALRRVPEGAVQVFGGIGYTWEHDAHLHLRRAACLTAALGPRAYHRDVASSWLEDPSRSAIR